MISLRDTVQTYLDQGGQISVREDVLGAYGGHLEDVENPSVLDALDHISGHPFDATEALKFARISKAVYKNPGEEPDFDAPGYSVIKHNYFFEDSYNIIPVDTHVYLLEEVGANRLIIAFRGTEGPDLIDWSNNINAPLVPYEKVEKVPEARVHAGFQTAYNSVRPYLVGEIDTQRYNDPGNPIYEVCFTGHSLGGALATLAALDYRLHSNDVEITVYTFGAPKLGNTFFASIYNERILNSHRIVNPGDFVPPILTVAPNAALPEDHYIYQHVDLEKGFSSNSVPAIGIEPHFIEVYLSNIETLVDNDEG